jgi:flagellar basal-body rod protein FlgB
MNVTPPQVDILGRMMNATVLNHHVISQNIANANTPNFEGRVMRFGDKLLEYVRDTKAPDPEVLSGFVQNSDGAVRADGNNVDLDLEVSRLNRNAVFHQTMLQLMSSQLGMMRAAITGR